MANIIKLQIPVAIFQVKDLSSTKKSTGIKWYVYEIPGVDSWLVIKGKIVRDSITSIKVAESDYIDRKKYPTIAHLCDAFRGDSMYLCRGNLWWGYLHLDGTYQAKRYFNDEDITLALTSPVVSIATYPVIAESRDEALELIKQVI